MSPEQKRILELETENKGLKVKIAQLEGLVAILIQEIERLKNPKNSRNSSLPPSKDENKPFKTKSLREQNGKKTGGQPGHEGNTLKMTDNPDLIIEHKPQYCNHCGRSLLENNVEFVGYRQIVDIPPIIPEYTEHRVYQSVCQCGHVTRCQYPAGVNSPISYGSNIEATIAYLHTRQYIPFERMAEYFSDVCNVPISQGAINDILDRFAKKATPAYNLIFSRVLNSKVAGSDETGAKVNGKNGWFWTWQGKLFTFIAFSSNRGFATIKSYFADGLKNTILVHDCWRSHFETNTKTHQICTAHLLRELNYFIDHYKSEWAISFKQMLHEALDLKKTLKPEEYCKPVPQRVELENTLARLLAETIPENMKDAVAFQKRIIKYKTYLFTFLYYSHVPPDNNASERAIRNIKVKQKVSGQFKTIHGAQIYAIIRSVTDTCIKNNRNILQAFHTIANLQPE